MREFILVDCKTGLIHGPYLTRAMARAVAEAEAFATWEIFTDGDALVDWSDQSPQRAKITIKARRMPRQSMADA